MVSRFMSFFFHKAQLSVFVILVALSLFTPLSADAASLEDAKASGQVGERVDGYVGFVASEAPADVVAMVKDVNNQRRQRYGEIAAKTGASLKEVGLLAGRKLIDKAPAGTYVMGADGRWIQR
jgi:uncharacterized protein